MKTRGAFAELCTRAESAGLEVELYANGVIMVVPCAYDFEVAGVQCQMRVAEALAPENSGTPDEAAAGLIFILEHKGLI